MINTYGYTMRGLQDAAKNTADWPENSGFCSVIRYDPEDGKVWASEISTDALAGKYDVCRTSRRVSAQYIADQIADAMRLRSLTAQQRYDAKNIMSFGVKICRNTDRDIYAKLESLSCSRQDYIRRLIRADIDREMREG